MNEQVDWASPLGISVALFLAAGGFLVLIGVLTPFFVSDSATARPLSALFTSRRPDAELFGGDPGALALADPVLTRLRYILLMVVAGLLVVAGVSQVGLAWFALRMGQAWALAVLTTASVVALPYWFLAIRPYVSAGVALSLSEAPPFMWLPALLLIPAALLGWIGTR